MSGASYLAECSSIWSYLLFYRDDIQATYLGQEFHVRNIVYFQIITSGDIQSHFVSIMVSI